MEEDSILLLEQANHAYEGAFSLDPATARQQERTFFACQQKLAQGGIAIRQNGQSGRWEIVPPEEIANGER
jgi:hypothetical protein